jgi:hypothetical protein
MRFLLGVLIGYSMRGKKKLLITILATVAFFVYIILQAIMLLALSLDIMMDQEVNQRDRSLDDVIVTPTNSRSSRSGLACGL